MREGSNGVSSGKIEEGGVFEAWTSECCGVCPAWRVFRMGENSGTAWQLISNYGGAGVLEHEDVTGNEANGLRPDEAGWLGGRA